MATVYDEPDYEPQVPTIGAGGVPTVTRRLLWINISIGVACLLLGSIGATEGAIEWTYRWFGLNVGKWTELFPLMPVWQLASYGFLHDTNSPLHLFFNMLGLYFFGGMLEPLIGRRRFGIFYMAAVILPACAQLVFSVAIGQPMFVVGASGAIMFLVVALATLRPHTRMIFILVPMKLWVLAVIYVAFDLFGLLQARDNVAHLIHLVGALFGFAAVQLGWLYFDPLGVWRTRKAMRQVEDVRSDEQKLDALLERIHREGIGALTKSEREFLKRMSARRGG